MSVVRFQCPSCQTPLRLENRALFLGRTFDCPDCQASLLIEAAGTEGVVAHVKKPTKAVVRSVVSQGNSAVLGQGTRMRDASTTVSASLIDRLIRRPALLGWIVAAIFAVGLILFLSIGQDRSHLSSERQPNNATEPEKTSSATPVVKTDSSGKPSAETQQEVADVLPLVEQPIKPDVEVAASNSKSPEPNAQSLPVPPEPELPPMPQPGTELPPPPAEDEPPTKTPARIIEARLVQKIARFEQLKPVPFVKTLDVLEDLLGVPIVWDLDTVDESQLQKPVTLSLKQTTVAEIFDRLLQQVRLQRRIVDGRVQLDPLPAE